MENLNQIATRDTFGAAQLNVATANGNVRLMGKYIVLLVVESQSSIIYPKFGQASFHSRMDVINICSRMPNNFLEEQLKISTFMSQGF